MSAQAKKPGWKDLPMAGLIVEAGNAAQYNTGSWRTFHPVWDKEKCTNCLRCWVLCPDSSILVAEQKVTGIDYEHCKGCGICARECPKKVQAITMILESEAQGRSD